MSDLRLDFLSMVIGAIFGAVVAVLLIVIEARLI